MAVRSSPNTVSVFLHPAPHTPRSSARGSTWVPKLSGRDAGSVSESVGELGGKQAPNLPPEGREEGDLTNPEFPILLAAHLGLSVWEGSQAEDMTPASSQRAKPA